MLDLLIKNAIIVDGSLAPPFQGDISIQDGKIAEVGALPNASATITIDAAGQAAAPGFIDVHSHADLALLAAPEAESLVQQGITTIVAGQCGFSPAPLTGKYRKEMRRSLAMFLSPEIPLPWDEISTFESYLECLERIKPAVNVVPLVGHGMIRASVMGYRAAPASPEQIRQMQRLVNEALDCGAFGVSTGLIYPPGSFASTEELIATLKPLGKRGGLYFSHARGEAATVLEAYAEAIHIGRKIGASVQISHFKAAGRQNWDKAASALRLIEDARAEGLDVTADMYPYEAGWTYLATLLPRWALAGGTLRTLLRLTLPAQRQKIIRAMQSGLGESIDQIEWEKIFIAGSKAPAYIGHSIAELAATEGKDPYSWTLDALRKTRGNIQMIILVAKEENLRMQLKHPAMMIGSDGMGMSIKGIMRLGIPHPRSFGTYPRLFGHYVRELGLLSLEEASWKSSGFPAQKLGLKDRGLIRKGYQADLVLFDPRHIADRATYSNPWQYPEGIELVIINGKIAVQNGRQSSERYGRLIRSEIR